MGNVLQPQNALPARPSSGSPAAAAEPANAEALGRQLRAGLPPMRLHSVSLYDSQGNVLWLSEGALGPDEHSLVLDALEVLSADAGKGIATIDSRTDASLHFWPCARRKVIWWDSPWFSPTSSPSAKD